jgi:hypothetical protein
MSSTTDTKEQSQTNDNWDEDKSFKLRIKKQNLVVISVIKLKNNTQLFRVRGGFEEYNDALRRVEELKKTDKLSFIFIGEMGKWLAIYYDLSKMNSNEANDRNDLLNNFMKQYKNCLYEEEQEEKQRKDTLLKGANIVTGKHKETTETTVQDTEVDMVNTKTNDDTEDYLDEDKPLRHVVKSQDFFNCSILNVHSYPEIKQEQFKDMPVWGLKIRGLYDVYSESAEKAEHLQKVDKYHNVFVGEVGKNYPIDVDVSEMGSDDQVYREKSLGKYMKSTKGALHEEPDKEEISEPLQSVSEPLQSVSEPLQSVSEPLQSIVEPLQSVVEPLPIAQTVRTVECNSASELEKNESDKQKLQVQLEESKANIANLEDKLSKINELYAKLKSS